MRDTSSDGFFSMRGAGAFGAAALPVRGLGAAFAVAILAFGFAVFGVAAFALRGFADVDAAFAFFGAAFAPAVVRVRIQILRSTHRRNRMRETGRF
jgi:hypothetical protein